MSDDKLKKTTTSLQNKVGRPAGGESDARKRLIDAARQLFIQLPYDKVSTRLIAERAGVNIAMIRYYFKNKAGLLEAMLQDTLAPMREYISSVVESGHSVDLTTKMRVYYQMMIPHPGFPRLIARTMERPDGDEAKEVLLGYMSKSVLPLILLTDNQIQNLQDGIDANLARLSCISLMVCPFLIPDTALKLMNFERNEETMIALLEHNVKLLEQGILTKNKVKL